MKKLVLLVVILAMVLGIGSLAVAQTEDTASPQAPPETTTEDTTAPQAPDQTVEEGAPAPETTPSDTTQSPGVAAEQPLPCDVSLFRQEQAELVQAGYPTSVTDRARECEGLGYVNPYPAPAFLGPDGFVYPYDPIEGQYYIIDPATGLYYILDPVSGEVSTYDPASGAYL